MTPYKIFYNITVDHLTVFLLYEMQFMQFFLVGLLPVDGKTMLDMQDKYNG